MKEPTWMHLLICDTLNNKQGIKQRLLSGIMTLVLPVDRPDTTSICTDDGSGSEIEIRLREKKVWIRLFFRINSVKYKRQLLCGTFESKGGEITARVKANRAFLDRNRCYLKPIHLAVRSDCFLGVMGNIISDWTFPWQSFLWHWTYHRRCCW